MNDDDNPFFETPSIFEKDHRVPVQPTGIERQLLLPRIPPSADDPSIIVFVEFSYFSCSSVFFSVFWDTKDGTARPTRPFNLYAPIAK